jgi:hypothetical protein
MVENKGKLIITEMFPSTQKHDIKKYWEVFFDDDLLIQQNIYNSECW